MRNGKTVVPDDITVDVWKCLGERAVEFFTERLNMIFDSEKISDESKKSGLVLMIKNKGDVYEIFITLLLFSPGAEQNRLLLCSVPS